MSNNNAKPAFEHSGQSTRPIGRVVSSSNMRDLSNNQVYKPDGSKDVDEKLPRTQSDLGDYVPSPINATTIAPVIAEVKAVLNAQKFLSEPTIKDEVEHFFNRLGLDEFFFEGQSAESLANFVASLATAKMIAKMTKTKLNVTLNNVESEGRVVYLVPSEPGNASSLAAQLEPEIETKYLGEGYRFQTTARLYWRMQVYRTSGTVAPDSATQLRIYMLQAPQYPPNAITDPSFRVKSVEDLARVSDVVMMSSSSQRTKVLISEMLAEVLSSGGTVIRGLHYAASEEFRLMVCYKQGSTHSFLSGLTDLYHSYGMVANRKYVEQFSHGFVLYSVFLNVRGRAADTLTRLFESLKDDASVLYCLPRTSISPLIKSHKFTQQEHVYAYCGWKFTYHFLSRLSSEYADIARSLGHVIDPTTTNALNKLKMKLAKESFTEQRILEAIMAQPALIQALYTDFHELHCKKSSTTEHAKATAAAYLQSPARKALVSMIQKAATTELDEQIFKMFLSFNQFVLKTNFYQRKKVAVSFRLDPEFLRDYPDRPFGVFFVVGAEFRGFHVRFADVARGGVRVVVSRSLTAFQANLPSVFDEVYGLASTQQLKNKDIPEGGSKGVILLSPDHFDKAETAFEKFVDALLDLLLPSAEIIDYYAKPEILFLGPDEGTADFMNWASEHARRRGAPFWKAFTTGKSPTRGGIPHDTHGMTTHGIHAFVVGCLKKLGLDESQVTKLQTGGPDGDLGSNEILVSKDRTIAIVDGSGVVCDRRGLNRDEITRLAKARKMVREFDRSKLSPEGFFVDVDCASLAQPAANHAAGVIPTSLQTEYLTGLALRNAFHLTEYAQADMFVPCGGRPRAVDLGNVSALLPASGPRFKVVVEGANLFFSQEARLKLEAAGVVLFKDSSANKGGVTSSSLEVLAALSLADDDFATHMCVSADGVVPAFYASYVNDVKEVIYRNAQAEFECLWREMARTKRPCCTLSDELSVKINTLNDAISTSTLWDNVNIRTNVLLAACPPTLVKLIGLDAILARVPPAYSKALFCAYLASQFVYKFGVQPPEFAFFEFVQPLLTPVAHK